jgi:hypothetical protein
MVVKTRRECPRRAGTGALPLPARLKTGVPGEKLLPVLSPMGSARQIRPESTLIRWERGTYRRRLRRDGRWGTVAGGSHLFLHNALFPEPPPYASSAAVFLISQREILILDAEMLIFDGEINAPGEDRLISSEEMCISSSEMCMLREEINISSEEMLTRDGDMLISCDKILISSRKMPISPGKMLIFPGKILISPSQGSHLAAEVSLPRPSWRESGPLQRRAIPPGERRGLLIGAFEEGGDLPVGGGRGPDRFIR